MKPFNGIPFWLAFGEFTAHFGTCFIGDWDVHWGYDSDFDPCYVWSILEKKWDVHWGCGLSSVFRK